MHPLAKACTKNDVVKSVAKWLRGGRDRDRKRAQRAATREATNCSQRHFVCCQSGYVEAEIVTERGLREQLRTKQQASLNVNSSANWYDGLFAFGLMILLLCCM